jgi:flagellar hook protein FlgE
MGFQQGLSGLNISSKSLEVIGNNVANANTFGFKTARAEFADMYAASLNGAGSNGIGIGARIASVAQQFTQGNISTTANNLDIAINGDGFFQVADWDTTSDTRDGELMFSRNGQFKVNSDGFIVNNQGKFLLGLSSAGSTDFGPLRLSLAGSSAQATSRVNMEINLSADAQAPQVSPFDPSNSQSFNYSTTQTAYDGSGEPAVLRHYFAKDNADPDTWWMYSSVLNNDGNEVFTNESGGVVVPNLAFSFDPSGSRITGIDQNVALVGGQPTATLAPPSTLTGVGSITVPGFDTRTDFQFDFDLSKMTQFAGRNSVNALSQNGYPKGDFSSFNIDASGSILVRYTNGQTVPEGQIQLARFFNPQGLQPVGGNEWTQTAQSGQPQQGLPGENRMGLLQGGALEESNVDLTGELVNMIVAQRAYQANAQTIKTEDQVLQTLVNLR